MFKKKLTFLLCVMLVLSLGGYAVCKMAGGKQIESGEKEVLLVTSFYPMYVLAQNLVPEDGPIVVKNLTENQTGCLHDYQLTAKDMKLLSEADAFVINGAGMELFIESVLTEAEGLLVMDATTGIDLLEGSAHKHDHAHSQEDEVEDETGEHHHEENGHVWMDVARYRVQAANVSEKLQTLFPHYAKEIRTEYEHYDTELEALEAEVHELEAKVQGQHVVLFHDAFAYLADSLSLNVLGSLALDEETVPSAGEIAELIEEIQYHGGAWILMEEAYAVHAEKIVAETGAKVIYLNPLTSSNEDKQSYLDGMRDNLQAIRDANRTN